MSERGESSDSASKELPPTRRVMACVEARSIKKQLISELEADHHAGGTLRPEDLLVRWPTDPDSDPDLVSLLVKEHETRAKDDPSSQLGGLQARFPQHKDALAHRVGQGDLIKSLGAWSDLASGPALALPTVGDTVFGFRLIRVLGSGAFASVFLAEQMELADRSVVIKLSDLEGDEPATLAQLQHTNIVPIHSVHDNLDAGLRAVCMPYLGGASLARVMKEVWAANPHPTRGEEITTALQKVETIAPEDLRRQQVQDRHPGQAGPTDLGSMISPLPTPRRLQSNLTFFQGIAWIVARLAEGLQHAHQRGILHRDIKPSNVLLAADGQPMLLDFNLALNQFDTRAATLGGTVSYMAPEHLRSLDTRQVTRVDHRADIYSLGMVLFELLAGNMPFDQSGSYTPLAVMVEAMALERSRAAPSLRAVRTDAPWALESILRRCLAPFPENRYQHAEELAEDLRRFIDDRPLKYAPELSVPERVGKWCRRHPRLMLTMISVLVTGGVITGLTTTLLAAQRHLASTSEQLEVTQARDRKRAFREGTLKALLLVNSHTDFQDRDQQRVDVCRSTLDIYDILKREDWQQHPSWKRLDPLEQRSTLEDTRELLMMLAWATVRQQPREEAVLRQALAWLDQAEFTGQLDPSPALFRDRAVYLDQLGDQPAAEAARRRSEAMPPSGARDHYLLAIAAVRYGGAAGLKKALTELTEATRLNPHYYWAWFQRGICHQIDGDSHLAASDFSTCVGLWPDFSWGHFNLGVAHERAGRKTQAIESYSAALRLDADFADARLNRGLIWLELGRHDEALVDFTQALRYKNEPALHAGRGRALEGLGRSDEADAAFREAFDRIATVAKPLQMRIRCEYGFAVAHRLPTRAREAFETILKDIPDHPESHYGLALLAVESGKTSEAIGSLRRALASSHDFIEARRHLAIQLARAGEFKEAFDQINWCLEREPRSGPTLYAAACVASLASGHTATGGRETAQQAITYLRLALTHAHGRDQAMRDPDLAAIRSLPEFEKLLRDEKSAKVVPPR